MNYNIIQISLFLVVSILLVILPSKLTFEDDKKKIYLSPRKTSRILDFTLDIILLILFVYLASINFLYMAIPSLILFYFLRKIRKRKIA